MKYTYDDIEYLGESTYGHPKDHWVSLALPEYYGHDTQFMFYTTPRYITGKDMEQEGFISIYDMKISNIIPINYSKINREVGLYVQQVIISVRNDYLEEYESRYILNNNMEIINDMFNIINVLTSQQAYQKQSFWTQEGIYDLGIIDPVSIMNSPIHGIALTDILEKEQDITEEEALRMGIMSIAEGEIPWWTYSNHTVYNITDSPLDYTRSGKIYKKVYIPITIEKGNNDGLSRRNRSITRN